MRVYRVVKKRRRAGAFTGAGSALAGSRWASRGRPVVYCAQSLALAKLETLVHASFSTLSGIEFVYFPVEVPDALAIESIDGPGEDRDAAPAPLHLRRLGDYWLDRAESAVLQVPSALSEEEHDFLLNTDHPDFDKLNIGKPKPARFDARFGTQ